MGVDNFSSTAVYALDLTLPAAPKLVGPLAGISAGYLLGNRDLLVTGYRDEDAVLLSDLSSPRTPQLVGRIPAIGAVGLGHLDGQALIATYNGVLAAVDLARPAALAARPVALPGSPRVWTIVTDGSTALLGTADSWLVTNLTSLESPQILATLPVPPTLSAVAAVLTRSDERLLAYLLNACGDGVMVPCTAPNRLAIYDLSELARPRALGTLELPSGSALRVMDLAVSGGYAFLATARLATVAAPSPPSLLSVVDVRTPAAPRLAGEIAFGGWPRDLASAGDAVYIAAGTGGLHTISVADPAAPRLLGSFAPGAEAMSVAFAGSAVHLATRSGSDLLTFDRTDPLHLRLVTRRSLPGTSGTMLAIDGRLLIAGDGLALFQQGSTTEGVVRDVLGAPVSDVGLQVGSIPTGLEASAGAPALATGLDGGFRLDPSVTSAQITPAFRNAAFWPPSREVGAGTTPLDFIMVAPPVTVALRPGQASTLTLTDTQGLTSTLALPANSISGASAITLRPLVPPPTGRLRFAGQTFEVLLDGGEARFDQPARLTLHYSRAGVRTVSDIRQLRLYRQKPDGWTPADDGCVGAAPVRHSLALRQIEVSLCAPGRYVLLGPTERVNLPLLRK